ncbi:MAG: VCBS repeat-containing protein [Planctomycetota bacterium]|nr:VCBS repeat-containing protein [Planctomycetota bacterium]
MEKGAIVVDGYRSKNRSYAVANRSGAIQRLVVFLLVMISGGVALWISMASRVQKNTPQTAKSATTQSAEPELGEAPVSEPSSPAPHGVGCLQSENPDDPTQDGWETEAFASTAKHQLEEILQLIQSPADQIDLACQSLVAKGFQGDEVLPMDLKTIFKDKTFLIQRQKNGGSQTLKNSPRSAETQFKAFVASLQREAAFFKGVEDLRIEVKVVGVDLNANRATTKQKIAINGRIGSKRVEQHAIWKAGWKLIDQSDVPLLESLRISDFEQTQVEDRGTPVLADCTKSVLGSGDFIPTHIFTGYPQHLDRIQDWRYCVLLGTPGMAIADVNGDGLEDLYVCQETSIPNLLLVQQPDGSVINEADVWGVDWIHNSPSANFADFDNDGDPDIAVVVAGGIILSSNEGDHFEQRAFISTADDTRSLSVAEYHSDGKQDGFVCVYGPDGTITDRESAIAGISYRGSLYHDATEGGPNTLLRNLGDWQFANTTEEMGLNDANHRLTLAASWEDFDNDGDMDLYVANDYAPNSLFRNDLMESAADSDPPIRKFTDIAEEVGASDQANGMSVSWADHNRDGWMDLYIGNMFSSAGNRVTTQKGFKEGADEDVRATLKRFARGNTLLENQGDGTFKDTSEAAGVTMGRWAWSSPFVDLNNDGWQDMFIVNGFITGDDKRDL